MLNKDKKFLQEIYDDLEKLEEVVRNSETWNNNTYYTSRRLEIIMEKIEKKLEDNSEEGK